MATKVGQIFLDIKSRIGEYRKNVAEAKNETRNLGTTAESAGTQGSRGFFLLRDNAVKFGDTMQKVYFAVEGVRTVMGLVQGSFGEWQSLAAEQERVTAALSSALRQQGIYTDELMNKLEAYSARRQRATGFDNEATEMLLAQLVVMGVHADNITQTANVAQDLAIIMGVDLRSAARVLAQALDGNMGAINRYIAGLDATKWEATDTIGRLSMLEEKVGGQSESFGQTGAGALRIYRAELDDVKKALGTVVLAFSMEVLPTMQSFAEILAEMETKILAGRLAMTLLGGGLAAFALGLIGTASLVAALILGLGSLFVWQKRVEAETRNAIITNARYKTGVDEIIKTLDTLNKTELNIEIGNAEDNLRRLRTELRQINEQIENLSSGWRGWLAILSTPILRSLGSEGLIQTMFNRKLAIEAERDAWEELKNAGEEAIKPDVPETITQPAVKLSEEDKERLELLRKRVQLGEKTNTDLLRELTTLRNKITDEKELLDIRLEIQGVERQLADEKTRLRENEILKERELARLKIANIENEYDRRKQEALLAYQNEMEAAQNMFANIEQLQAAQKEITMRFTVDMAEAEKLYADIDELREVQAKIKLQYEIDMDAAETMFVDIEKLQEAQGEISIRYANELIRIEEDIASIRLANQREYEQIRIAGIADYYEREREQIIFNSNRRIENIQTTWENEEAAINAIAELQKQRDMDLHELNMEQYRERHSWWLNAISSSAMELSREIGGALDAMFNQADNIFTRLLRTWINAVIQELMRLTAIKIGSAIINVATGGATIPVTQSVPVPQLASGAIAMPKPGGIFANIAEAGETEFILPLSRVGEFLENAQINVPGTDMQSKMIEELQLLRDTLNEKDFQIVLRNVLSGQKFLRDEMPRYTRIDEKRKS